MCRKRTLYNTDHYERDLAIAQLTTEIYKAIIPQTYDGIHSLSLALMIKGNYAFSINPVIVTNAISLVASRVNYGYETAQVTHFHIY